MADGVVEVQKSKREEEKWKGAEGEGMQQRPHPHPFNHLKQEGAEGDCAEVKDPVDAAQHGQDDGKEEEVHRYLAKHLCLKPETVEASGERILAEVEESRIQ